MQSQNYLQKSWYRFREAIWPILEPEEVEQELPIEPVVIEDENLDQAFTLISKFADAEEDRRKTVESKATLLLSTISIATTLIVASNTLLSNSTLKTWPVICSVGISFFLCLYAIATVWYSIMALGRGNYSVLSFKDINHVGDRNAYKKHLITSIWKKTRGNFRTVNHKVDYMNMAQQFYKRAIIIIGLYSLLIFLFCLFYQPNRNVGKPESDINVYNSVNSVTQKDKEKTSPPKAKNKSISLPLNQTIDTANRVQKK